MVSVNNKWKTATIKEIEKYIKEGTKTKDVYISIVNAKIEDCQRVISLKNEDMKEDNRDKNIILCSEIITEQNKKIKELKKLLEKI